MKTEIEQLKRKLVKKFHQATATYRLLEDGDRILVGLSGGKDSLLLLELLLLRHNLLIRMLPLLQKE